MYVTQKASQNNTTSHCANGVHEGTCIKYNVKLYSNYMHCMQLRNPHKVHTGQYGKGSTNSNVL